MLGYKGWAASREGNLLQQDFILIAEGMKILPEDTREYARSIQQLPDEERRMLLPRVLLGALGRFGATRNVQDVSSSTHTMIVTEAERLESELSMIRYIAWAIPSIGFIGTVRRNWRGFIAGTPCGGGRYQWRYGESGVCGI